MKMSSAFIIGIFAIILILILSRYTNKVAEAIQKNQAEENTGG